MATKKTSPTIPSWMKETTEVKQSTEVMTEVISERKVLKLELTESKTDFPCVVVQGRGSRENVSYINVPFSQDQIQRLQSRIFGNQAVAIPILLMRALDEIEEKGIRLEIKAARQLS